jgi:hypothetical protein
MKIYHGISRNNPRRNQHIRTHARAHTHTHAQEVQRRMTQDLDAALDRVEADVLELVAPLEALTAKEVARAEGAEAGRAELAEALAALGRRAAAVE